MRKYYAEHREAIRESAKRYNEKKKLEKRLKVTNPRLFDMKEDYKTPTREDFQKVEAPKMSKSMEYYYANRERILEQQRENRARKKRNEKQRAYYAANREHICELQKKNRASKKRQEKLSKTFMGRLYLKIFG